MNFRPELAAMVMAGTKTVTRRATSPNPRSPWWEGGCALRVDQDVAVCPGRGKVAIGRAVIVSVSGPDPVGWALEHDAREVRREGFSTLDDFIAAWTAINGTYDPSVKVWRIGLRPMAAA